MCWLKELTDLRSKVWSAGQEYAMPDMISTATAHPSNPSGTCTPVLMHSLLKTMVVRQEKKSGRRLKNLASASIRNSVLARE